MAITRNQWKKLSIVVFSGIAAFVVLLFIGSVITQKWSAEVRFLVTVENELGSQLPILTNTIREVALSNDVEEKVQKSAPQVDISSRVIKDTAIVEVWLRSSEKNEVNIAARNVGPILTAQVARYYPSREVSLGSFDSYTLRNVPGFGGVMVVSSLVLAILVSFGVFYWLLRDEMFRDDSEPRKSHNEGVSYATPPTPLGSRIPEHWRDQSGSQEVGSSQEMPSSIESPHYLEEFSGEHPKDILVDFDEGESQASKEVSQIERAGTQAGGQVTRSENQVVLRVSELQKTEKTSVREVGFEEVSDEEDDITKTIRTIKDNYAQEVAESSRDYQEAEKKSAFSKNTTRHEVSKKAPAPLNLPCADEESLPKESPTNTSTKKSRLDNLNTSSSSSASKTLKTPKTHSIPNNTPNDVPISQTKTNQEEYEDRLRTTVRDEQIASSIIRASHNEPSPKLSFDAPAETFVAPSIEAKSTSGGVPSNLPFVDDDPGDPTESVGLASEVPSGDEEPSEEEVKERLNKLLRGDL